MRDKDKELDLNNVRDQLKVVDDEATHIHSRTKLSAAPRAVCDAMVFRFLARIVGG